MNISLTWPIHALDETNIRSRREWSKKACPREGGGSAFSPAQIQGH
ncbi:MAG: hypothetical protein VST68_02350 [Nitrospirota bacterium]|nr:hypothetical protein [Nitrospirota bacterium]